MKRSVSLLLILLIQIGLGASVTVNASSTAGDGSSLLTGSAKRQAAVEQYKDARVLLGGYPFGMKLYAGGVTVVGFTPVLSGGVAKRPASDAGLCKNDVLTSVNGQKVIRADEITEMIAASGGEPVRIGYTRKGKAGEAEVTPVLSDESGRYAAGMWIRDSTSGIGTVTFIDAGTGAFAGLGHGIVNPSTGKLVPLSSGIVTNVTLNGISKGVPGDPGEIKGYFSSGKIGTLLRNTDRGVFGILLELPELASDQNSVSFGFRDELCEGEAEMICTLPGKSPAAYKITISSIAKESESNKNFVVTVTDPVLIEEAGGIVQGFSGSPILQGGKLVGAVTHVLVSDPTRGYGIFIENMLADLPDVREVLARAA